MLNAWIEWSVWDSPALHIIVPGQNVASLAVSWTSKTLLAVLLFFTVPETEHSPWFSVFSEVYPLKSSQHKPLPYVLLWKCEDNTKLKELGVMHSGGWSKKISSSKPPGYIVKSYLKKGWRVRERKSSAAVQLYTVYLCTSVNILLYPHVFPPHIHTLLLFKNRL